jgi:hypothetical protein
MLKISDKDFNGEFTLDWRPLMHDGKKVTIWDYPRTKEGEDRPVIYRHVVEISGTVHTIYVGEGRSLNGPKARSLVFQYSHGGHGATRGKIRQFFANRTDGWTELLHCPEVDLHSDFDRLGFEKLLEGFYYWRSRRSPDFASLGLFYLNGRQKLNYSVARTARRHVRRSFAKQAQRHRNARA